MNVFSCLLNSVQLTSLSRRLAGKLFQIRGPAAAKHVTKTTVNTSDRALSPRREPEGASRTFWGEMNIVSQIGRYFAWQHLVYQAGNLEFNSSSDRQPMKLTQYRCDAFATFGSYDQPYRSIMHRMYLPHEFVSHSVQQRVAVVQASWNERLDLLLLPGSDRQSGRSYLKW